MGVKRITKKQYYDTVAERLNLYPEDVAAICQCLQAVAVDYLMLSDDETSVHVQLTDETAIAATYKGPSLKIPPKGLPCIVDEHLEFKLKLSNKFKGERMKDFQERRLIAELAQQFASRKDKKE